MSSPKASLHMLYIHSEKQPRYETTSVAAEKEIAENGLVVATTFLVKPLSVQQSGFRCTLFLPDLPPVVSDVFTRKKEAEQDAARKALEQKGKSFTFDDQASKALSTEEKVAALIERLKIIFSEKVITSCQPLKEHFRAAMRRKDRRHGAVPAAVLAVLDNRISSLCKSLHASSDSDLVFAVAMVWEAAKRCPSVTCEEGFLIKRKDAFCPQFKEEFLSSDIQQERCLEFQAVYISSEDAMVTGIPIQVESDGYYLDTLSKKLGIKDGSGILMSRTIPRAPPDSRLYCAIPDMSPKAETLSELPTNGDATFDTFIGLKLSGKDGLKRNRRASDLLGYSVYGDAILASVGSSWKSEGKLSCADVPISCYYRLLLGRTPEGNYKLSKDAILVSKLPSSFSSRSQWRGMLPRSLLIDFCHQHRLADPEFSVSSTKPSSGFIHVDKEEKEGAGNNSYKCKTKVVYEGMAIEFESEHLYRNRNDAVQSASLQVLHCLSKKVDIMFGNPWKSCACKRQLVDDVELEGSVALSAYANGPHTVEEQVFNRGQGESNKTIVSGSVVFISCDVWLTGCDVDIKVESHEEFEFEIGVGAIIPELENVILGMQVGGYEQLSLPVPNPESVLATHEDATSCFEKINAGLCSLKYAVKVIRSLEPLEERMESALFSPPLSKQRNEFAVNKIKQVHAKTLVDFGCGSGSLLDAVIDNLTDLECIAGIDISLKSLLRAAKSLNTKLGLHGTGSNKLKQVVLYEGSLADPDPCLCGFDIATCIEVVEHMDPEPLAKAGEIILGTYTPRTLILSTPNIEHNVLLQKLTVDAKTNSVEFKNKPSTGLDSDEKASAEDLLDENRKTGSINHKSPITTDTLAPTNEAQSTSLSDDDASVQPIKFRNDDHRFEWTRAEFKEWAGSLASRYGYTVEYTGVGGSDDDPGFASQIAIFTRNDSDVGKSSMLDNGAWRDGEAQKSSQKCCREVWKYDKGGLTTH